MTENGTTQAERLDSWKAIADYLQRDERTVRRWEKTLALPVRRVPGSRGHSVFAYVSEVEIWLKTAWPAPSAGERAIEGPTDAQVEATTAAASNLSIDSAASDSPARTPSHARWRWSLAVAATLLVMPGLAWVGGGSGSDADTLAVHLTPTAVVAAGPGGAERWRYPFPGTERAAPVGWTNTPTWVRTAKGTRLLVATSGSQDSADDAARSGQLLWLTPAGRLDRMWTLDDRIGFRARQYGSPWAIIAVRVDQRHGTSRVALAAHHYQWWPGLVTVLDTDGRRQGTFVNAGWIERVHWQSADRLIVGGFSNARDGGMVALLDANALDGQSPAADTSEFRCTSCAAGGPLRYVVLPRTEVNLASGSPFNRAMLQPEPNGMIVRTIEVPGVADAGATDVFYEFSPSLDILRASYSDRYWDMHRTLEAQGKITHTRAQCPDRDGPRQIDVWEPGTGWRKVAIAH